MVVQSVMVKDLVRDKYGLGPTIDDLLVWSVVVIKVTTTKDDNSIRTIIGVACDEAWW